MDKGIFTRGMLLFVALYPDYPLKPETTEVYWQFLKHLSNLDFEWAVKRHVTTCKWFPKVSEILQAVQDHLPTPIDIWSRLLAAAAETGKKPEMDAATEKALAIFGGWEAFQYTPIADLQYRFKDFKSALLEARARDNLALVGGQAALEGE